MEEREWALRHAGMEPSERVWRLELPAAPAAVHAGP
jgi:hypothetical protein